MTATPANGTPANGTPDGGRPDGGGPAGGQAGRSWSGRSWAGRSWSGRSWSGRSRAGRSRAGRSRASGGARFVPVSAGALLEVARRPRLWATVLRQGRVLVVPGWWGRWPPLPLPSRPYLAFRLEAMFGGGKGELSPGELVGYLEWCRWMRALAR